MATPQAFASLASRYKALPRQQQLAVLFGLPAVVFLGFAYLSYEAAGKLGRDPGISSLLVRQGGVWAEIESTRSEIAAKELIIAKRPELEARKASLTEVIAYAESKLPREAEKASMRQVIERLAREIPADMGTVQFKSVRILETDDRASKSDYRTVTYQTEILGDMNGIIKYIDSIEKNTRFMTVNTIAIKGGDAAVDTKNPGKIVYGLHQVRMDLVTYIYAPKAKGAKP
jgi:Tfp pilus assembly protein PilO